VDDDSDYEEEPIPGPVETGTNDSAKEGCVRCHSFLPGAFSTWKSLSLYLCFNEITFGPLRSQEASLKSPSVRRSTREALSCSPKSTHHLAQLLGLDLLANLGFNDVISKLTSENIVVEFFSKFTARDARLMEKQCLLLTSSLKTPKTTAMVQRCIQEMAGGASPHCYDALELAFGNTANAIRHERQKTADADKRKELEEVRYMLQPRLNCNKCGDISLRGTKISHIYTMSCSCGRLITCSGCHTQWRGGDTCGGCAETFM